jgi:hypothetical protein
MNIKCPCGNIIVDDGEPSHQSGHVLRDQDSTTCSETTAEEIAGFIQAIVNGRRQEWVEQFYGQVGFDLHDGNVVLDILTRRNPETMLGVYQCDHCGRLSLERAPKTFSYRTFKPEQEGWTGALAAKPTLSPALVETVPGDGEKPWWKLW